MTDKPDVQIITPPSDAEVIERVSSDDIPALVRRVLALDEQLKAGPDSEARRDTWGLLTIELTASAVLIARAYSAALTRISTLERELGASNAALMVLDELYAHADFRNGNTDQSGSMDEGSVLAGRLYDRAVPAIEAARRRSTT